MERLRERIEVACTALKRFQEVMTIESPTAIEKDAAIQRFEFTFEALWKATKDYLYENEGLDIGSPKGVIRSCREIGLLSEGETILALQMVNDRNLTVHTYNEALANEIFSKLKDYFSLMTTWLDRMKM